MIAMLVTDNAPAFARGFAALCVRPDRLDKFHPDRIHQLASFASHRDTGAPI